MVNTSNSRSDRRADRAAAIDRLAAVPSARLLWGAVLFVMVADLVSTVYGLRQGFHEGNPVVADVLASHGVSGLVALKLVVLAWAGAIWRVFKRRYGVAALVGLFLPQAVAVASNCYLILST